MHILPPLVGALILVACGLATPAAARVDASTAVCAGDAPVSVRSLPRLAGCDLTGRVVYSGSVAVTVPPPGHGAGAAAAAAHGREEGLHLENRAGVVRVRREPRAPAPATVPTPVPTTEPTTGPTTGPTRRAPAKCSDKSYRLEYGGHPWASTLRWSYNSSTTPKGWRSRAVVRAVKRAGDTMAAGRNACGITERIDADIGYAGTTRARPAITSTASRTTCGASDSTNVVAWGPLSAGNLGFTCYWWNSHGAMIGADMLFAPTSQLVNGVPGRCTNQLDLQSLATHEWGHAFGLDHVSQAHANLVMPHLVASCSLSDRTLGLGDYLGLKRLYGVR